MSDTTDDLVVITGSSRGIGQALARLFVADGREVIGISRSGPQSSPNSTTRTDDGVRALSADLGRIDEIERVVGVVADICAQEGRGISYLVNNAGALGHLGPLGDHAVADLERLMALHVYAPMRLVTGQLDSFHEGARVLNIASRAGHIPIAGVGAYCISKHAEVALTGVLRLELGHRGILLGTAIPGEVDTRMQQELRSPNPADFALAEFFRANVVNLIPVDVAARFLHWILTATTDEDFAREDDWFIYDEPVEPEWLPPGEEFRYPNPDA
ncbi:MAG: hypothetical protein QG671_3943 [Actinomycetota bacterium]|nr:hypothetical protein [Actinomycetota bacterium]